jgi:hypothetical protein
MKIGEAFQAKDVMGRDYYISYDLEYNIKNDFKLKSGKAWTAFIWLREEAKGGLW